MKSKTKKKKKQRAIKPGPGKFDRAPTRKRKLNNPVPQEEIEDDPQMEGNMTCFDLMKAPHRFG